MFGAGGELDLFAEQVLHAAQLARRVVARWRGMAVKIAAHPAGRVDDPPERGGKLGLPAALHRDPRDHGVILGTMADRHVVVARGDLLAEHAIVAIADVLHGCVRAVGAKVGIGSGRVAGIRCVWPPGPELHLAGEGAAPLVGDPRGHQTGARQRDLRDCGQRRRGVDREPRFPSRGIRHDQLPVTGHGWQGDREVAHRIGTTTSEGNGAAQHPDECGWHRR